MSFLIVGFGGVFGSLARFALGRAISGKAGKWFPLATFIINITGAFLLGCVSTFSPDGNLYLLLADGFLGAYTTFSTFMYEGFKLFEGRRGVNAVIYIVLSVITGAAGYVAGAGITRVAGFGG